MAAATQTLDKRSNSLKIEGHKSPYKVCVGFEKDVQGCITSLEIIDGYIGSNERLKLKMNDNLPNGVSYFELEVVPHSQMNTYLKIPVLTSLQNSIVVKVFKQGSFLGGQCIDQEGNIIQ
jgi:hypothetical protein